MHAEVFKQSHQFIRSNGNKFKCTPYHQYLLNEMFYFFKSASPTFQSEFMAAAKSIKQFLTARMHCQKLVMAQIVNVNNFIFKLQYVNNVSILSEPSVWCVFIQRSATQRCTIVHVCVCMTVLHNTQILPLRSDYWADDGFTKQINHLDIHIYIYSLLAHSHISFRFTSNDMQISIYILNFSSRPLETNMHK